MADTTPIGGSGQDINSTQQGGVRYLGQIARLLQAVLPRVTGTFTLGAAATTVVTDANLNANAVIMTPVPVNASAATLMGSAKSLYISAQAQGQFTVATANAAAAAGTEQFKYIAYNPL